jgi:hypothetical protein
LVEDATIDGLALMEWANARLGKAPRLSHPVILDRPCAAQLPPLLKFIGG